MTIKARNITKFYGNQCILDAVDFTLRRGGITGFLGVNGAGKTTTMKILTGYLHDWQGSVSILGKDLREDSLEIHKMIGYLPEHNPIDNQLYVREYLEYVAGFYLQKKEIKNAVFEVIEKVGLQKEQHKKIGALSKGYKQRVGLAQALVHTPQILILDEPTSGLDPKQLEKVRELLKNEAKDKIVLFSTHILQEVEAICDRVLMIEKGKIVSTSEDFKSQQTVRVEFLEEVETISLPVEIKFEKLTPKSFLIYTENQSDVRPLLFQFAINNHLTLLHLSQENCDIQSLFKK